jgi:hypothetical protein
VSIVIQPVHIERYKNRAWGLSDPCFICGGKFKFDGSGCGHDGADTAALIQRVKELGPVGRDTILHSIK